MSSAPPPPMNSLRAKAEARLAAPGGAAPATTQSTEELLHELQVHQVELEMQNEELKRAQIELAESRDKYLDLYDFAPVGYFTLNHAGLIVEANLTAAALLNVPRSQLLNRPCRQFVAPEDVERWDRTLVAAFQHVEKHLCEVVIRRKDGSGFHARLDCLRMYRTAGQAGPGGELSAVRMVMSDITAQKEAEAKLAMHLRHLEELVAARTAELTASNEKLVGANKELTQFNKVMVDRELRMIEMKKQMNALCAEFGKPPPYPALVPLKK
ncbi:MAG: PAS domain-containing protein [Verrucomicrobia bacterium]|nr:PAS domain-containing protein [Verrucomicrobiota bacterium]